MPKIRTLSDVVSWRLCLGCGACAYISPATVRLFDFSDEGIRPVVSPDHDARADRDCLAVCPVVQTDFRTSDAFASESENESERSGRSDRPAGTAAAFAADWGPTLEIWEGHAADPDIRFKGSSGGALTALAAWCLERGGFHGVLHTGQDPEDPIRNRTRLSRARADLIAAAGSRYSPASVCDGLGLVEEAPAPCAVVGKPVEIAAVENARRLRPVLHEKVGATLSFFCAETPPTHATLKLLEDNRVAPSQVQDLRYRGFGWPGHFAPTKGGQAAPAFQIPYQESWSFLQKFRPWAVHMWPDGSGELADISCGDPWYEQPDGNNPGFSLVVVRTERGREIVRRAIEDGYLHLTPAEPWKLVKSQSGLLNKKGAIWGRRAATRLVGLPVTRFSGLDLFHCWRPLSLGHKLRATLGTLRRLFSRGFVRPLQLDPAHAKPVAPAYVPVTPPEPADRSAP